MVLHGAACGNFSPLNVLGAIVYQSASRMGVEISVPTLFFGNIAYNFLLAIVIYVLFGGLRLARDTREEALSRRAAKSGYSETGSEPIRAPVGLEQACTLFALLVVAVAALCFDLNIGFLSIIAAVTLHLAFLKSSAGADRKIAWGVVLLICGIVTYVTMLQRLGTVDALGAGIADMGSPVLGALLICGVGALTSAFASSAGILGAMMVLAAPFLAQGGIPAAGLIMALSVSATVVDSSPFSTAGALVVANTEQPERERVYRGLFAWGGAMVLTAPPLTWFLFIILAR
jgi:di/tricarboxylate transporter